MTSDDTIRPEETRKPEPRLATVHVRELLADTLTPLAVYQRLASISPVRFLFESVTGGEQVSRFSFMGAGPRALVRIWGDRIELEQDGVVSRLDGPPLEVLAGLLEGIRAPRGPIPFTGGWVGYFGYDLIRLIERLPNRPPDPFGLPIAILGRFDTLVVFDHARQRILALANEIEGEVSLEQAEADLAQLTELLTRDFATRARPTPSEPPQAGRPGPASLDGKSFRAAVEKAKEYIRAGDIFQVVLARRFTVPDAPPPLALYRALRMVNPSPYMVLLELPDTALVGASPEMLVRRTGLKIEMRPIAGTRPRGADAEGDRLLAEDMLADPKERAEHVMLVDLGRNDVGKVGAPGTVRVSQFMEVERYSHVMHLVSSVEADLEPGRTSLDALVACFPAGTVSGAPKIRAMEIVDELEPEARGPYAGAVGYQSFSGDLDTCITIRTLVVRGGETSVTAGAGIVADSDPAAEESETENKAAGLLAAVDLARELEGPNMILLIDNYDSFTWNLVQLMREAGAEVEVVRNDVAEPEALLARGARGVVLSPGPGRPEAAGVCPRLFEADPQVPLLGVCLGHQVLGMVHGAVVDRAARLMHGKTSEIRWKAGEELFEGLPNPFTATRYHSLAVVENTVPDVLEPIAWSEGGTIMALRHRLRPWWGVQFHPESILTPSGPAMLGNFLRRCGEIPAREPVEASA